MLAANVAEADRIRIAEMLGNRFAKGSDHIMDANNASRSGLFTKEEIKELAPKLPDEDKVREDKRKYNAECFIPNLF